MSEDASINVFVAVIQKHRILETVATAKTNGWEGVWNTFTLEYESDMFEGEAEKRIYTDLFFHQCLSSISPVGQNRELFTIIEKWYHCRNPQNRCGHLGQDEKVALIHFTIKLRSHLLELLTSDGLDYINSLSEEQQRLLIALWRQVFFEPFSALCLYWNPQEQEALIARCLNSGYGGFAAASMYLPFGADDFRINIDELLTQNIPLPIKTIILIWMVNTPYFHGTEKHRQKLMLYIPALCRALTSNPAMVNTFFFFTFVQEVMTGLWRSSYIGGNNLEALAAFGDFISFVMKRSFLNPLPQAVAKKLDTGEKIRVGYISRNFYKQAVSCYMVNRVICHSRDKFEVCIFALGDYHDNMSELFKDNCDSFERFTELSDLRTIANGILEQKLDILIYTDIGMDPVTYMLSGLQLAPVQCALVGHGTSTGMPSIQYYLSGDFESPEAQKHYREKLIRLPKLGAAQYLPMEPQKYLSRKQLGIPKDAVVFVSCANGLKHGKARYPVFVDILVKAPNAWVLLKPYAHITGIDYNFAGEILALAVEAGVAERLKILPPIGDASQVLGLLAIADVQLDSYPYGGWTTNMEALAMGLPIVTQEGELARSRWGAGMLRALGIAEGIAADDAEYVGWAVKLAGDPELRKSVRKKIKRKVKKAFFDGPAAQHSYEEALLSIYQDSCNPQYTPDAAQTVADKDATVILTSLAPSNLAHQLVAMQTWIKAGFKVVSVNAIDEIAALRPLAPDIEFVAAARDGRQVHGRPYIYISDMLKYFQNRDVSICGIINSDVFLLRPAMAPWIRKEINGSFLFGSRVDIEHLADGNSSEYDRGFDYFFFDKRIIDCYPENQDFCMGQPWWDYWITLVPLMHGHCVKRLTTPVVAHVAHGTNWNINTWLSLGEAMAKNFKPPFLLTADNMARYAEESLKIIKTLSREVTL